MEFMPDKGKASALAVPYFEDSHEGKIPGYDSRKGVDFYQKQI